MLLIELAVLTDHLRFNPQTELHTQSVDLRGQGAQPTGELFLVGPPVPQTAGVIIAVAEPAVVQHKELHSQIGSLTGQTEQLGGIKIEIGGLPAVHQYRLTTVLPHIPKQVLPDGTMELPAHLTKSLLRADHGCLRSGKDLAGLQSPAEVEGVDAQSQAGIFKLGPLCRGLEVSAVYQSGPIAGAVFLVSMGLAQHDKGVVLMAGDAPDAAHRLNAGAQRSAVQASFFYMAAVKGDEIQLGAGKVQAQGGSPAQTHRLVVLVCDPNRPGDEITVLQYAVEQLYPDLSHRILQGDDQCIGLLLLGEEGGQSLQGVLSPLLPGAHIPQVGYMAAVRQVQLQRGQTEVPRPRPGVLLRQGVQRVGPVISRLIGVGREAAVGVPDQPGQVTAPEFGAVVGVEQKTVLICFHLIGGVAGL